MLGRNWIVESYMLLFVDLVNLVLVPTSVIFDTWFAFSFEHFGHGFQTMGSGDIKKQAQLENLS